VIHSCQPADVHVGVHGVRVVCIGERQHNYTDLKERTGGEGTEGERAPALDGERGGEVQRGRREGEELALVQHPQFQNTKTATDNERNQDFGFKTHKVKSIFRIQLRGLAPMKLYTVQAAAA